MSKLVLIIILFIITGCGKEVLKCEQDMPNAAVFNTTGKILVTAEYKNQKLVSYNTLYKLDVRDFSDEQKANIFQSLQNYFDEKEEPINYQQNFYQSHNYVAYEKVYNVNRFEITEDLDTIDKLKKQLEKEGYQCD